MKYITYTCPLHGPVDIIKDEPKYGHEHWLTLSCFCEGTADTSNEYEQEAEQ